MRTRTAPMLALLAGVCGTALAGTPAEPLLGGHQKLLVLPIGFDYFKQGFTGHDTLEEKTETSKKNLDASMGRAFRREKELQTAAMPDLTPEEAATLAEHLTLLKQVISSVGNEALTTRHLSWRDWQHGRIDYSIGPGLGFLADRAGTDAAVYIWGSRLMPSPGVALLGATAAAGGMYSGTGFMPGAERNMSAVVFDLRTGDIIDMFGVVRGLAGEPYDVPGANTWMHALFDPFPEDPINQPQKKAPNQPEHERFDSRNGFSFMPPENWRVIAVFKGSPNCYRHGQGLERIRVDRIDKADAGAADPLEFARTQAMQYVEHAGYTGLQVVRSEAATVAGQPGFEVELSSALALGSESVRFRHLIHGFTTNLHVYLFEYDAPAIYYFDHYLPDATAALASLQRR
jgi:hypothetical protein